MATIKKIAKLSGVSATTVSNVLHGRTTKVSPETLEKVQAVLKAEKYAPNLAAQILAHQKSHIIGVIIYHTPRVGETMIEDPFTSSILGAFEEKIRLHDYYMMIHITDSATKVEEFAKSWNLDGLLILWFSPEGSKRLLDNTTTPIVFIDSYLDEKSPRFYNVGLDDFNGGYIATKYLIEMGHTKIGFVTDDTRIDEIEDKGGFKKRLNGYKAALKDNNIEFKRENIILLSPEKEDRFLAYNKMQENGFNFTALFFIADYYAAEATSFFQKQGIQIPNDISVVGYDDVIYSKIVQPQITTVHQNIYEKGCIAAEMLFKLINNEKVVNNDIMLPVKLIKRDSVKKIN